MTERSQALDDDPTELRTELAQAERDEEWALVVVLGWLALLAFIVAVLLFSPVPWGALIGLAVWALGVRGVFRDLALAIARTRELRQRMEEADVERADDGAS